MSKPLSLNHASAAPQRSEAWFAARVGRITGSRVAAILGDNPYQKPADVLRAMVREHYGAAPEFSGNAATEYGTLHEPDAKAAYEFETGNAVAESGLVVHPEHDWLAASPDGLVSDDGAVEFKCPFSGIKPGIPRHYWHQVQLVMLCADRAWCDYYVWSADDTYLQRVERDPAWLDTHMPKLRAFMDEYARLTEDEKAARPYLEDLIDERSDGDWLAAVEDWREARAKLAACQEVEKAVRDRLVEMAGERTTQGGGVRVIRSERAGNVNYKKIPELSGVDLEAYRGAPSVVYRIQEVKS